MSWYAAHLILYVKVKGLRQNRFPVWENVVLVRAASEEEAFDKAERRGKREAGDDAGSFRWGGKPARWVFAGVRKLTLCDPEHQRPTDGTEITYNELELASEKAIQQLVDNEPVEMRYHDKFTAKPPRLTKKAL